MEVFRQNRTMKEKKAVEMGLYWKDTLPLFISSLAFLHSDMFSCTAHVK